MGRAARWFRNFLGLKKPSDSLSTSSQPSAPVKDKRRWSFVRSHREPPPIPVDGAADRLSENDRSAAGGLRGKEVMAVAGTVLLRKRELDGEDAVAVAIQSAFRGYLARRALRALKGLVKIQALVRGYIVRKKRTAEWLCQMQALLRAQARARADRALISASSQSTSKCLLFAQHPGPSTPEKLEPSFRMKSSVRDQSPVLRKSWSSSEIGRNWLDRNVDGRVWDQGGPSLGIGCSGDFDRGNEIPVTCGNTRNSGSIVRTSRHLHSASRSFTAWKDSWHGEAQSAYPVGFLTDEAELCTENSSPQIFSAVSKSPNLRRSPFTPSKSDDTRSYFCGYSDYPNYMSYTESSRAKVRSASTPRQRSHFEKMGSVKRNSMHGFGESRSALHKSSLAMFTNFASKAYPGSGRLDRRGMPIRGDGLGYRCPD